MSELYKQLRADIITAVKARDSEKALALRTMDGAIQRVLIDDNSEISDELVLTVVRKAVKDLQAAKEQFAKGGRDDLVAKNEAEITLLEVYLPVQMEAGAVEALVASAIAESGAQSPRDMGKVMGILKRHPESSLIDFGLASKLIKDRLSQ